jgi:hypothetical protein
VTTTAQLESLFAALMGAPRLPSAACIGLWALMDDVDRPDDALKICGGCSSLQACHAWASSQPNNSLHGIVGGRIYEWTQTPSRRKSNHQSNERESPCRTPLRSLS